jgi:hypothetical protein
MPACSNRLFHFDTVGALAAQLALDLAIGQTVGQRQD